MGKARARDDEDEAEPVGLAGRNFRYPSIAGYDDGYLANARITWNDEPTGNGTLGMAIKTRVVQINQDFESHPTTAPWREEALRQGYRFSIVRRCGVTMRWWPRS